MSVAALQSSVIATPVSCGGTIFLALSTLQRYITAIMLLARAANISLQA
jgi:hypothetical protein